MKNLLAKVYNKGCQQPTISIYYVYRTKAVCYELAPSGLREEGIELYDNMEEIEKRLFEMI